MYAARLIAVVLLAAFTLQGWGPQGHRAAARLAEQRLSRQAARAVKDLLGGSSLADVASWADEVRSRRRASSPWHYINIPVGASRNSSSRFCPANGCVVSAIHKFAAVLKDPRTSSNERREALKFLVHFVGDLHQPLHAGDRGDKGGNDLQVVFFGKSTNLHRIWDSAILLRMQPDEAALLKDIRGVVRESWTRGTVEDWAWEAQAAARHAAYGNLPKGSRKLAEPYQKAAEPVVRTQLAKAGVRLAAMLNTIWP